jgi:hypothetical protein
VVGLIHSFHRKAFSDSRRSLFGDGVSAMITPNPWEPTLIQLASELKAAGFSGGEVARLARRAELRRVRRGAYARTDAAPQDEREAHRELVMATLRQCGPAVVVSHMSAAALHNLPLWSGGLQRVHLTHNRSGGGHRRRYLEMHGIPLDASDVTHQDDVPLTTLARTVVDLACCLPAGQAVAIGDAALRRGLSVGELDDVVGRAARRHGIAAARRALALLDAGSESPGESVSRVALIEQGLPRPVLQFEVFDESGRLVGRADFAWPELRTLGEFDGKVKYGRLLGEGERLEDVLFAEKRREDALRDQGWNVVRWGWADLAEPGALAARLRRAFARGGRRDLSSA